MSESIARLHRALVDAMVQSRHHRADQPVTVAEIYQDLIPYRTVRTTVGFALNADYEHALLQLLAGEGGFARIEPVQVQQELRMELQTSNPNVSVFRNYAACDVFVALPGDFEQRRQSPRVQEGTEKGGATRAAAGPQTVPANGGQPEAAAQVRPAPAPPRSAAPPPQAPPAPPATVVSPPEASAAAVNRTPAAVVQCGACSKPLPRNRNTRYCPYCGREQAPRHCVRCQEPVEQAWKFCVACGTPTA